MLVEKDGNLHAQPSNLRKGERELAKFFKDNPGEELTIDEAASKIGVTYRAAGTYLARLSGMGMLKRYSVYSFNTQEGQ